MVQENEPADLETTLARAFGRAWAAFLRIEGPEVDTAENRGNLAARIVVVAKLGETNEKVLADAALIYLRAFLAARALPGSKRSTAVPTTGKPLAQC